MNTFIIYFLLFILIVGLALVISLLLRKKDGGENQKIDAVTERLIQQSEKLTQLSQQNSELRQELDRKLSETHRTNQEQFGQNAKIVQNITSQSAKLIADVTEKLTKLDETNKQVVNFSAQLQNLQDILKNPKLRGVLGEYFLEESLKNVLPPKSYQMHYPF